MFEIPPLVLFLANLNRPVDQLAKLLHSLLVVTISPSFAQVTKFTFNIPRPLVGLLMALLWACDQVGVLMASRQVEAFFLETAVFVPCSW